MWTYPNATLQRNDDSRYPLPALKFVSCATLTEEMQDMHVEPYESPDQGSFFSRGIMSSSLVVRIVVAPLMLLSFAFGGTANADSTDRLMKQLTTSSDYKVRISAALSLSRLREQRAVPSFIRALKDKDKTVRGVAAASLGKIVNSSTKSKVRIRAISALKAAAASDSNSFVRRQAQKAYDILKNLSGKTSTGSGGKGGTYVNIGLMSAKVNDADKIRAHMRKTVQKTFKKKASSMMISWPGGKAPSKKQLDAKKVKAFHINGTLNELSESKSGRSTTVTCKVSMLIATYVPKKNGKVDKSMFGFLKGGASVQSSSSPKEVQYAREDCVSAVMEDLVVRKIIPTLKSRP